MLFPCPLPWPDPGPGRLCVSRFCLDPSVKFRTMLSTTQGAGANSFRFWRRTKFALIVTSYKLVRDGGEVLRPASLPMARNAPDRDVLVFLENEKVEVTNPGYGRTYGTARTPVGVSLVRRFIVHNVAFYFACFAKY
jgi:hypothetical protein